MEHSMSWALRNSKELEREFESISCYSYHILREFFRFLEWFEYFLCTWSRKKTIEIDFIVRADLSVGIDMKILCSTKHKIHDQSFYFSLKFSKFDKIFSFWFDFCALQSLWFVLSLFLCNFSSIEFLRQEEVQLQGRKDQATHMLQHLNPITTTM